MRRVLSVVLAVAVCAVLASPAEAGPIKKIHQAKVKLIKNVICKIRCR